MKTRRFVVELNIADSAPQPHERSNAEWLRDLVAFAVVPGVSAAVKEITKEQEDKITQ